jgi:hypothetical protein
LSLSTELIVPSREFIFTFGGGVGRMFIMLSQMNSYEFSKTNLVFQQLTWMRNKLLGLKKKVADRIVSFEIIQGLS